MRPSGQLHRPGRPLLAGSALVMLVRDQAGAVVEHPLWRMGARASTCEPAELLERADQGGSMAGKFVVKKGASGKYHFNLLAANGQVIATSETYERKQSALNGIESVKANAPGAEVADQTGE
jgi:uncharacterized protein